MALRLTIGFSDNPSVQPLKDGVVKPQGIELDCVTLDPSMATQWPSIAWYEASVSLLQRKTWRQHISQRHTASSAVGSSCSHRMGTELSKLNGAVRDRDHLYVASPDQPDPGYRRS